MGRSCGHIPKGPCHEENTELKEAQCLGPQSNRAANVLVTQGHVRGRAGINLTLMKKMNTFSINTYFQVARDSYRKRKGEGTLNGKCSMLHSPDTRYAVLNACFR